MIETYRRPGWVALISAYIARAIDLRAVRVLCMVCVAFLGASIAYMNGKSELKGGQLERELAHDNLLALTETQRLRSLALANAELSMRIMTYERQGRAYFDANNVLRQKPQDAVVLALEAQEEFAAARAVRPFVEVTGTSFSTDLSQLDVNIKNRVASSLAAKGIEAEPDGTWRTLDAKLQEAHVDTRSFATGVVILILSLVAFTFSDLSRGPFVSRLWLTFGILIALGANGMLAIQIHETPTIFVVVLSLCSTALVGLAAAAWIVERRQTRSGKNGHHAQPGGFDPRDAFETLHQRHVSSRFARGIVLLISVTVLLSAISGYFYSEAVIESANAAHEALRHEVEMHSRSMSYHGEVLWTLEVLAQEQEERARYASALQRASVLENIGQSDAARLSKIRATALREVERDPAAVRLLDDAFFGVQGDLRFPRRLANALRTDAPDLSQWNSLALWDGFQLQSLTWNEKASVFLASLMMFAVALYLFGQAYSMGRGHAVWVLLFGGLVLVAIGTIRAAVTELGTNMPVNMAGSGASCPFDHEFELTRDQADALAAHHYAEAHVWLADARTVDEYRHAIVELSCVVKLRPESALMQLEYARAIVLQSSFQTEQSYSSLPLKSDLTAIIGSLDSARTAFERTHHSVPAGIFNSHGRYGLLRSLATENAEGVKSSLKDLESAKKKTLKSAGSINNERARILINLAVAQLATGLDREAEDSFGEAINAGADKSKRLIVRALTDLEILRTYCSHVLPEEKCVALNRSIDTNKTRLVVGAWQVLAEPTTGSSTDAARSVTIEAPSISVSPDMVRWYGNFKNLTANDKLTVVWYEFNHEWNVWRAIPEVSGEINYSETRNSSGVGVTRSFLEASNFERCLGGAQATRYRAEFYVNGKLLEQVPETAAGPGTFKAVRLFDLNVALCEPSDWRYVEIFRDSRSGGALVQGLAAPDGRPAVFGFAFYAPKATLNLEEAYEARTLKRIRTFLVTSGWIASDTEPFLLYAPASNQTCDGTSNASRPLYKTWMTADGMRYFGVALPRSSSSAKSCVPMDSMTNHYRVPELTSWPKMAASNGR